MTSAVNARACTASLATAHQPGAIAIIQFCGDVEPVLARMTKRASWPLGTVRLCTLRKIDEAIITRPAERSAVVMPHGGLRIVQQVLALACECGADVSEQSGQPLERFPEAESEREALVLEILARAESPLAIDLLLDQPRRWSEAERTRWQPDETDTARFGRLNRLIVPPMVVTVGPANVGKSTLSNALAGREVSITMDEPGTTRDYTCARVNCAGLVVDWHDTPGLRDTDDPVEREAAAIARTLIDRADLLIALTDAAHDWPALPRPADLRVATRSDLETRNDADVGISALSRAGLGELVELVRERLVPRADIIHPGPWAFDERIARAANECSAAPRR